MRMDLRAQVTFDGVVAGARAFGHWWISELLAILPDERARSIKAWLARPFMRLVGPNWVVSWPHSNIESITVDASLPDPAFRNALRRQSDNRLEGPIGLELPARVVLRRTVRLPVAALTRLRSAVELQLERYSPFRKEDAEFDCFVPSGEARDGEVDVEVAIVPRATLERYQDWLQRLGLTAVEFQVEGSDHRFSGARTGWKLDRGSLPLAVAAIGAALWLGAYLLAPSLREGEIESVSGEISALRVSSNDASRAKDVLDQLSGPAAFLAGKEQVATPLDALEILTLGFPNNARLSNLEIEGNRVRATGESPDAMQMMNILSKSNRFADIHFNGPIEKASSGHSRFTIDATLRTGGAVQR
jgi:general secretion pathway protein L